MRHSPSMSKNDILRTCRIEIAHKKSANRKYHGYMYDLGYKWITNSI